MNPVEHMLKRVLTSRNMEMTISFDLILLGSEKKLVSHPN